MKRILLLKLALLVTISALWAPAAYAACGHAMAAQTLPKLDSLTILRKFIAKGYSAQLLKFDFELTHPQGKASLKLNVKYNGKTILEMTMTQSISSKHFESNTRSIAEGFENTGVGTVSYIVAAVVLYEKLGVKLTSGYIDRPDISAVSPRAFTLWVRFRREGYATSLFPQFSRYEMNTDGLISSLGNFEGILSNQTTFSAH